MTATMKILKSLLVRNHKAKSLDIWCLAIPSRHLELLALSYFMKNNLVGLFVVLCRFQHFKNLGSWSNYGNWLSWMTNQKLTISLQVTSY